MDIRGTIVVFDSGASGSERISVALRNSFRQHFVVELSQCEAALSRILALRPVLIVAQCSRDGFRSTTAAWAAGTGLIGEVTRFLPGTRWVLLMPDDPSCASLEDAPVHALTVVSWTPNHGDDFVAAIRQLIEGAFDLECNGVLKSERHARSIFAGD